MHSLLKMKKLNLILTALLALMIGIGIGSTATLDSYQFCKNVTVADENDWTDPTKPKTCSEPASEFLTTDEAVFIVLKLSSLNASDEIAGTILDPSGTAIYDESQTITQDFDVMYIFRSIKIAEENRQPGTYTLKVYINGEEAASGTFTITEDLSALCEEQGFYCCPSSKICLSAQEKDCLSGSCCTSEDQCVTYSPQYFSRKEITNCEEEGLNNCGKVVKLYEYSIHGKLAPPQAVVIYYRGIDIDCGDKTDVAMAYYNDETGTWASKSTSIEETAVEGAYKATVLMDYLGYVALIRTDECVPMLCTYGGYRTKPTSSYVDYGEDITFELCGLVSGCEAIKDGKCDKECLSGIDPDCGECTVAQGDCCLLSYDGKCDLDCAPSVDPDCCDKSKELCCSGNAEKSGSEGCDKNCGASDEACTGCTPNAGDCCNAAQDGACDSDCPKSVTGPGYIDPDCCAANGISSTNSGGDCCNTACDGVCDPDCVAGLDPDCSYKCRCGTQGGCTYNPETGGYECSSCDPEEDCLNCQYDCGACYCGDGRCVVGTGEDNSNCPQDCPVCGDNQCTGTERNSNCPQDCYCGNNRCDPGEDCSLCEKDCGYCSYGDGGA